VGPELTDPPNRGIGSLGAVGGEGVGGEIAWGPEPECHGRGLTGRKVTKRADGCGGGTGRRRGAGARPRTAYPARDSWTEVDIQLEAAAEALTPRQRAGPAEVLAELLLNEAGEAMFVAPVGASRKKGSGCSRMTAWRTECSVSWG
jgi:hypothetical protein